MSHISTIIMFFVGVTTIVASTAAVPPRAPLVDRDQFPLQTMGRWIVDNNGSRVKFACVNWSGAAQKDGVPGGLQHQRAEYIASKFAALGFNCVRIPWSVAMVRQNWKVYNETLLRANPSLLGLSALEILDAVVDACAKAKLVIVLDNHMSDPDWCCSTTDKNGLWYNDNWSEIDWISAHVEVAKRYNDQPYVVAGELRNELRSSVVDGETRSPTWGDGSNLTDWRAAAERASTEILRARPNGYLIVVDSLAYSTDFTGVFDAPIRLSVEHRLVYSAHDYSWSQSVDSKEALHEYLGKRWGYLVRENQSYTAPVWVSEFGTWHDGRDISSNDDGWWSWFVDYLLDGDFDFGYWRGDGTESRGTGRAFDAPAGFGVLDAEWKGPASNGTLLRALRPLQAPRQGPSKL